MTRILFGSRRRGELREEVSGELREEVSGELREEVS
jgi:hypothetical protein